MNSRWRYSFQPARRPGSFAPASAWPREGSRIRKQSRPRRMPGGTTRKNAQPTEGGFLYLSPQAVAQGTAHRNSRVEPGEHAAPNGHGVEVGDDRGGCRSVGGLADADKAPGQEQEPVGSRQADLPVHPRRSAGQAPQNDADADQQPA